MPQPSKKAKPRMWKVWAVLTKRGRLIYADPNEKTVRMLEPPSCIQRATLTLTPPSKPQKRK